jgi:hypothetical protein
MILITLATKNEVTVACSAIAVVPGFTKSPSGRLIVAQGVEQHVLHGPTGRDGQGASREPEDHGDGAHLRYHGFDARQSRLEVAVLAFAGLDWHGYR